MQEEINKLTEELERATGKKVLFKEDFDSANLDIQRAVAKMAANLVENIKEKSKFYARKHNIRQDAIETMFKNDFIKYINSKL